MMKKGPFYIAEIKEIDRRFYQELDDSFIFNRALTLHAAARKQDEFLKFADDVLIVQPDERVRFFEALRADVLFAEFQQTEAVFALIAAAFQKLPHWLYLTTYSSGDLHKKVEQFVNRDYEGFSGVASATIEKILNWAIYSNCDPTSPEEQATWSTNLANIDHVLRRAADRFLKADEYNAYKHGVRVLTGKHGRGFIKHGESKPFLSIQSDDSVSYLEIRRDEAGRQVVCVTTKHFNPEESITILQVLSALVRCMRNTRLARIKNEERVDFATFAAFDLKTFDALTAYAKFTEDI